MAPARIVLVGMMGSGKTTIGTLLAARLGRPYRDNDAVLRERYGTRPAELLAVEGADRLHALEAEILRDALATPRPLIVGAPGGAVLDSDLRRRLRGEYVVWLRARPATLAARTAGTGRPFLDTDRALAAVARLAAERDPAYAEVADLVVDVDDRTPEEVAAAVVRGLPGGDPATLGR